MTRSTSDPALDVATGDGGAASGLARELVSRVSSGLRRRSAWPPVAAEAVDAFCESLLHVNADAGAEHLSVLQARGVSLDALYSGYLAGAAKELGRRWDEDELSFADVSLGMTRLQRLLRELGPAYVGPGRGGAANAPLAFVAAAPGERHIFGPVMFADQLRRLGWQVRLELSGDPAETAHAARAAHPAAIGVSAGSRVVQAELAALIAALREAAPGAPVVLGGAWTTTDPAAAASVGADRVAANAHDFEAAAAASHPRHAAAGNAR